MNILLLYDMMWYLLYTPKAEVDISLYYIWIIYVFKFIVEYLTGNRILLALFSFAQRDILATTIAPTPKFINGRRWMLSEVIYRSIESHVDSIILFLH